MDLLIAKINQGFGYMDADRDGTLDENDHLLMGQRAAAAGGHEPGSPAEQRIVDVYLRVWRDAHLPNLPAGQRGVSREQFVASTAALAEDPTTARAVFGEVAERFLEIADFNADGRVSPDDFYKFQRLHFADLTRDESEVAFNHLDSDGDGYLDPAEFVNGFVDYWTSRDPDVPGNWWAGRWPDVVPGDM